jgi:hypothetical protein
MLFALFALPAAVAAQITCNGGLGDPIVDITFGSGPNFGPPLVPGITNLTYLAEECIDDGYYSIVSSVVNRHDGTWLNVTQDHTGDPEGYFMLINASFQPSQFYLQSWTGLCPGTTYQFAAGGICRRAPDEQQCPGRGGKIPRR